MKERLHLLIEGRVQGVGYRYSAYDQATRLGLHGWVRNLPDGSVEAEFEGPKPDLDAILEWCKRGPGSAHVRNVEATWDSGEAKYDSFRLRF